jgi:hypothetical protein
VGVESVLSLSMLHIIGGKCVYFVIIFLKKNEERKYNINKKYRFYMWRKYPMIGDCRERHSQANLLYKIKIVTIHTRHVYHVMISTNVSELGDAFA